MAPTKVEVNVPINRMWGALKDITNLLKQLVPNGITNFEIAADGTRKLYFHPDVHAKYGEFVKEKVNFDDKNKKLVVEIIGGGLLGKQYKSSKFVTWLEPGKSASCTIVSWERHCEPIGDYDPSQDDQSEATLKLLEGHLVANPALYA